METFKMRTKRESIIYIIYVGNLIVYHCNYPTSISFSLQPPFPAIPKNHTTVYENCHNQTSGGFFRIYISMVLI